MRKPNKREMILAGVLAAAVVFTISLDGQSKRRRRALNAVRASAAPSLALKSDNGDGPRRLGSGLSRASALEGWHLDPFDRPFTRRPESDVPGSPLNALLGVELVLRGVIRSGESAAAMIRDEMYRVGDRVDDYTVESIGESHVLLRSVAGGHELRLELE